jgi:DNA modification methylase
VSFNPNQSFTVEYSDTLLDRTLTKLLTQANDLVIDPFAGSNPCGAVAEELGRRWLGFDEVEEYLRASRFRFNLKQKELF